MGLAIEKKNRTWFWDNPRGEYCTESTPRSAPSRSDLDCEELFFLGKIVMMNARNFAPFEILFFFSSTLPHSNSQENCLLSLIYRNTFRVILNFKSKKLSKMPNWNFVKLLTFCLHFNFLMQFDEFFSIIFFCFEFTRFLIW